jgi:LysR family transcriptional regulator for bpeEF and oprC
MDFIQQLRIFVAVADHGSFARGAEALRLARPSVTNAIVALEDTVGACLLHRTTRRASLTGEGEVFYERATQVLADAAETRNLFGGSSEKPRGRLRIDIPVALAKSLIIPGLAEFNATFPDVDIVLGVSDQPADLLADGIDCVLRLGELAVTSMVSRVVAHVALVTCASPAYFSAWGMPKTIDDLASHKAIIYFSGRGRHRMDWHFLEGEDERTIRMKPAILVNDSEALVSCALEGMGMIQALGVNVEEHLATGRLVVALSELKALRRPVSIMYPARQHLAPQVRAFIDWITDLFAVIDNRWVQMPTHRTIGLGDAAPAANRRATHRARTRQLFPARS